MTDQIKMGMRIRKRREELSLTLKDVADGIGVASSTIMRYENGTIQKPKLPVIESISKFLNVDPAWICCKSNDMTDASAKLEHSNCSNSIDLSTLEKRIILEYRDADEISKAMVLRALSIDESLYVKGDGEKMA